MLKKSIAESLKVLGFDVEKLEAAVKAEEEVAVDIPELMPKAQATALANNLKAAARTEGFTAGKTAMSEILVKDLKAKMGLEFEGKDVDTFVTEATKKLSKSDDGIKKSLSDLQEKYKTDLAAKDALIGTKEQELFSLKTGAQVTKHWTKGTIIPKHDLLTLFNTKYALKDEDGRTIVLENGQVLKDEVQAPKTLEAVSKEFYQTYIKKDGMGGGDNGGGAATKFKDFDTMYAHYTKAGENPMDHAHEVEGYEKSEK